MKKTLLSMIIVSQLAACALFEIDDKDIQSSINDNELTNVSSQRTQTEHEDEPLDDLSVLRGVNSQLSSERKWNVVNKKNIKLKKNVTHYARGIMQDLVSNLQYVNAGTPLAVADFVMLDGNYETSPLLGKQLAEAFSHEVHKLGVPVVDYKLTDFVRVTTNGSIALSKDYLELSGEIPIRYVLTGTLLDHGTDIIVNARVVGVESKAIVASAQGFIPKEIVSSIYTHNSNDGIF